MYTAKLNLSPENVDDVLAVASFLQMHDIITACHALKSLAEPTSSTGENTEASAVEGKVTGACPKKWSRNLASFGGPVSDLGHLPGCQILHLPCCHCRVLVRVGQALLERVPTPALSTPGPLGAREQSCCLPSSSCPPPPPSSLALRVSSEAPRLPLWAGFFAV